MDSSTKRLCELLERLVPDLKQRTGSTAFPRFTAVQILKKMINSPQLFQETERISLISSFATTLFLQHSFCPIDLSDGSGMNLMNLWDHQWDSSVLSSLLLLSRSNDSVDEEVTRSVKEIIEKLGPDLVDCNDLVGTIGSYWQRKYGFHSDCQIRAGTGDNCSAFIAAQLSPGDIALSLGTSDTIFASLSPHEARQFVHDESKNFGHIFIDPQERQRFMSLVCFQNGALARLHFVRMLFGPECSADQIDSFLRIRTGSKSMVPIIQEDSLVLLGLIQSEITPMLDPGQKPLFCFFCHHLQRFRIVRDLNSVPGSAEDKLRALLEAQIVSMRLHGPLSLTLAATASDASSRLVVMGGGSKSREILQLAANIFDMPVWYWPIDSPSTVALGGAIRSRGMATNATGHPDSCSLIVQPEREIPERIYARRLPLFRQLFSFLQSHTQLPS